MNKSVLIMTICLLSVTKSIAQILTVDELIVSDIKVKNDPNIINEGNGNGPHIRVVFTLHNNTKEDIFLDMDLINVLACFKYKGKEYEEDMIWQPLVKGINLKIPSNNSMKFSTSTYIFLGTNLWKEQKEDYTLELLETLPTLRIKYRDAKFEVVSTAINDVVIK